MNVGAFLLVSGTQQPFDFFLCENIFCQNIGVTSYDDTLARVFLHKSFLYRHRTCFLEIEERFTRSLSGAYPFEPFGETDSDFVGYILKPDECRISLKPGNGIEIFDKTVMYQTERILRRFG